MKLPDLIPPPARTHETHRERKKDAETRAKERITKRIQEAKTWTRPTR